MGVIVKRPIANAAWRNGKQPPGDWYTRPYWDRLRKLDYDFIRRGVEDAVAVALRFTLGTVGVTTAIVGTTRPERVAQNIAHASAGPLPPAEYEAIRARWRAVARRRLGWPAIAARTPRPVEIRDCVGVERVVAGLRFALERLGDHEHRDQREHREPRAAVAEQSGAMSDAVPDA